VPVNVVVCQHRVSSCEIVVTVCGPIAYNVVRAEFGEGEGPFDVECASPEPNLVDADQEGWRDDRADDGERHQDR
jgi:hypothetical protein